jgi:hypothetical protein
MLEQSLRKRDCLFCQFGGKVFQKAANAKTKCAGTCGAIMGMSPQEHENLIRHYFADARSVCQVFQLMGKAFVFHQFVP